MTFPVCYDGGFWWVSDDVCSSHYYNDIEKRLRHTVETACWSVFLLATSIRSDRRLKVTYHTPALSFLDCYCQLSPLCRCAMHYRVISLDSWSPTLRGTRRITPSSLCVWGRKEGGGKEEAQRTRVQPTISHRMLVSVHSTPNHFSSFPLLSILFSFHIFFFFVLSSFVEATVCLRLWSHFIPLDAMIYEIIDAWLIDWAVDGRNIICMAGWLDGWMRVSVMRNWPLAI